MADILRDARTVLAKDLLIERSSRVVSAQVVPFAVMILILFGFGISPDLRVLAGDGNSAPSVLARVTPGLIFLAVLFAALLALGRSFSLESEDNTLDGLRMADLDPAGIFLGKAVAVFLQLVGVTTVVTAGAFLFFTVQIDWTVGRGVLGVTTAGAAITAIAAAGTLYSALASGQRERESLVPLLVIPVLAPVLLGASQAAEAALFGAVADGWPWVAALAAFAALYVGAGILSFETLLEDM